MFYLTLKFINSYIYFFIKYYSLIQIPSESNQTYFEFKKKRRLIGFYPRSYSTFVNKQEQPLWKCDNDLIFFSLLSDNSNLGFACITPKNCCSNLLMNLLVSNFRYHVFDWHNCINL